MVACPAVTLWLTFSVNQPHNGPAVQEYVPAYRYGRAGIGKCLCRLECFWLYAKSPMRSPTSMRSILGVVNRSLINKVGVV